MIRGRTSRAVILIAIIAVCCWAFIPPAHATTFTEAYGTFSSANNAIDGNRKTIAESTNPYRGEFFLVARFSNPSIIRNARVYFEGAQPKNYVLEMGADALNWRPYDVGEKTTYLRVRMPAKEGEVYKISEVEANYEVATPETFGVTSVTVSNVETTTAVINAAFTKPVRLSLSYGLEPRLDALGNFTEYTSYMPSYQVKLKDLIEGVDYYVRIKAISADGDVYVSDDADYIHFRLLGTPPLRITSMGVGYVSPLAFSMVVQTNIPSHCVFYFGEASYFTNINSKPDFDTYHLFEFKDLRPNHMYSYMAFLTDFRGLNIVLPKAMVTTAEVNIARGKKVIEGTFTQLREPGDQGGGLLTADSVLQRLTDGKNDYFSGMAHSGNIKAADQYAVIDLGREYTLESHLTIWRRLAYPYYYEIQTSLDGKNWNPAIKMPPDRISQGQNTTSGAGGDPLVVVGGPFQDRVKARYVKLLIPKGSDFYRKHSQWTNVDLAEIVVYPGGDDNEIKRIVREEWRP